MGGHDGGMFFFKHVVLTIEDRFRDVLRYTSSMHPAVGAAIKNVAGDTAPGSSHNGMEDWLLQSTWGLGFRVQLVQMRDAFGWLASNGAPTTPRAAIDGRMAVDTSCLLLFAFTHTTLSVSRLKPPAK